MYGGFITILGGLLAASSFIIARKPNAKELLDKITPYQGWIGVVLFVWGIRGLLASLSPFNLFWVLSSTADLLVGFLLGFGLITKYALSKNETALAKGQAIRAKLVGIQVPLGFAAIVLGVLFILRYNGIF